MQAATEFLRHPPDWWYPAVTVAATMVWIGVFARWPWMLRALRTSATSRPLLAWVAITGILYLALEDALYDAGMDDVAIGVVLAGVLTVCVTSLYRAWCSRPRGLLVQQSQSPTGRGEIVVPPPDDASS